MSPLIQFQRTSLPIVIVSLLTCFALSQMAQAISPLPDGGYADGNTAEGTNALLSFTGISPANGADNTAIGFEALFHNTMGHDNTATGFQALSSNTIGFFNMANGSQALSHNTMGDDNTATGVQALFSNTTGFNNTATGSEALFNNKTGADNTATGENALLKNVKGGGNTATGSRALGNTTGNGNIALGADAGLTLTTGDGNIYIGNLGASVESNRIRIGDPQIATATFIAGIHGATASGGAAVFVNSSGQLGTLPSSARFKDEIKPMDKASEAILALKPVTFRYKEERDPKGIPQFGLVAEEVEKVNPDLITRDADGKPYTVRYDAVNAMLLNEFLKEHRKVEEQGATIAKQQKQIDALTAGLQKVSAQVELKTPAPQTVLNNQ